MKNLILFLGLVALIVSCATEPAADIIYLNGRFYTVDQDLPWAEAVAIKDGKYIRVGTAEEVEAVQGDHTQVIDLNGHFVMPGLIDAHTHPFLSAFQLLDQLILEEPLESLEDIQKQVVAYVKAHPEKKWIEGFAWPKGLFPMENPHRDWLDAVLPDIPISLMDQGGHSYWCNTAALEKAGMLADDYREPEFAIIERDDQGVPTGTIREAALGQMKSFIPKPSSALYLESISLVQDLFLSQGVTAHRTATGSIDVLKALHEASKQNLLALHWAVSLDINYHESTYSFEERMDQIENRKQYESEFVYTDYVKIFVDGDLNGYGIKMLEPFEGTESEYGHMSIEPNTLNELTHLLDQKGLSIQYHCIGGASIRAVADAFEYAAEKNGGSLKTRHFPDHMGFPAIEDLKRMIKLNPLIGYAPYFAFTFPGIHESYIQFVGEEQVFNLQPVRSTLDAGAIVATGTDWASLPMDPWPLIEGLTNRKNPWDPNSDSNNPSESVTLEEAIYIYTMGGAYAMLKEDLIGSIKEGKFADFVVLNHNLFEIQDTDISETQVKLTVFNGKEVFNHERALNALDVLEIEISNPALKNAVDAAELDLLVHNEITKMVGCGCFSYAHEVGPGSNSAPRKINEAFARLSLKNSEFLQPASTVLWKADNTEYWIQWTNNNESSTLWAYDPELDRVVEILKVSSKK